jgi:Spy/CpxP family protein refolding chaperone
MELERRVRARMAEMMREQLGLSEEEDARLSEIVQGFEGQRRQLGRQERAVRRRVEALMLEGGQDLAEAAELLQRMSALRVQEAELIKAEHEALLEEFTPIQVLRLVHLREQLGQRIQRLRGQPGRGGGRGGGDVRPGGGDGPFEGPHAFGRVPGFELSPLGGISGER